MSGACTRNVGYLRPGSLDDGQPCGRKAVMIRPVAMASDGRGRRRVVGPVCGACWTELLVHGYGPSVAGDSFCPDVVLERLATSGTAEVLSALAARGRSLLPATVVGLLVAAGVDIPDKGACVDLVEARAFAESASAGGGWGRRVSAMVGVGLVAALVAGAVGVAAVRWSSADSTRSDERTGSSSTTPGSSVPVVAPSSTSISVSTSTTVDAAASAASVPVSVKAPSTPSVPATTSTSTARPPQGWVAAASESCVSVTGVAVTITWSVSSGSVPASRLLLDGVPVASGVAKVEWSGDGAAASGVWVAEVQPVGAWSGTLSMAGCA